MMNRRSFVKMLALVPAALAFPWKAITNRRIHGVNYASIHTTPKRVARNLHVYDLDRIARGKERMEALRREGKLERWHQADSGYVDLVEEVDTREGEGWIVDSYAHQKRYGNFELGKGWLTDPDLEELEVTDKIGEADA